MADQMQDMLDLPRDFVKEGTQFMNRCTKPDQKEFIKICQAVGVGCESRKPTRFGALPPPLRDDDTTCV